MTAPQSEKPAVAYIHHTFPSRTATFVYRETAALRRAGMRVMNVACKRPSADVVHAEAREFLKETLYMPALPNPRLYLGALVAFVRQPLRFLAVAWRVVTAPGRGPFGRRLAQSLAEIARGGFLARLLRNLPQVAHVHAPFSTETATMAWMASRLTGIPFTFTSHTAYDARLIPRKVRDAQFVAAISRFDKERLLAEAGRAYTDKVHVVHCGVSSNLAPARGKPANTPIILSVGSLIEKKGHVHLIRACGLLRERETDFVCRIAGEGPLRESLEKEACRLGVRDSVHLLGPRDQNEVRSLYGEAAVFVLASVYAENGDLDGIPVVLMEAMAAGVPCVSTRASGIPELISSPGEGILVEEKDPVALADAIEKLLKDSALRERIAKAARPKIEREFNLEKSAAQLAELFNASLVATREPVPRQAAPSETTLGEAR